MRKTIMVLSLVLFSLFIFSGNNLFAADCASGTIKRLGANPGGVSGASPFMVQIDCANDATWPGTLQLYLSEDLGEPGLATLLTAYSLGKTVWVRTLGTVPGSIATVVYIND